MTFQRDADFSYYIYLVRHLLDDKVSNMWMVPGGPISCSARSLDLKHGTSSSAFHQEIQYSASNHGISLTSTQKSEGIVSNVKQTLQKVFKILENTISSVARQNENHIGKS